MTAREVLRGAVVTPDGVVDDGVVVLEGDVVAWVGSAQAAPGGPSSLPDPTDDVLLPGLVDLHCHGGGGVGFPDATDPADARVAVHEHLRHGTTTLVGSLVTADRATLLARAEVLAELVASGDLVGVHAEGPFLARERCGAQDPALMVPGDPGLVRDLARVLDGGLVSMTVAPEVPGVLGPGGVVEALVDVGALPSVGHTDASVEAADDALRSARRHLREHGVRGGLPTVTHLFNGMRPLHHRDPGPVAAALAAAGRGEAVVELVGDGVHVAAGALRAVLASLGPDAVALVSDALAATGAPDGEYPLGTHRVRVRGGEARLVAGGALAGSTAHLLDVVRATVAAGVPLVEAVRAASTTPARVLGRPDLGALEAGRRGDVVVTDADLRPRGVWRAGRPLV